MIYGNNVAEKLANIEISLNEITPQAFTENQVKLLRLLCDMAKEDIIPNELFSDTECNIWSMFTESVRYGKRIGKQINCVDSNEEDSFEEKLTFYDDCMDAADWIEALTGQRIIDEPITYDELEALTQKNKDVQKARGEKFDYPLSEIPYIMDNADDFNKLQLVRFNTDRFGFYEYRMCEI